ncbi:DUF397 domain-containing protein [Streptomyces sp. NPDC001401]|uniref:DUF397 domain-containing protein n=1 Tax=Streptomyces sp. NPDC001401 TaxID=3364570 RepID=UPI0036B69D09
MRRTKVDPDSTSHRALPPAAAATAARELPLNEVSLTDGSYTALQRTSGRDSKSKQGPHLTLPSTTWEAFLTHLTARPEGPAPTA